MPTVCYAERRIKEKPLRRRSRMSKLSILAAAAFPATGVGAATPSGSSDEAVADALRDYASCIISIFPRRAVRLLQSEPGSVLERDRLGLFFRTARGGRYCWPSHESLSLESSQLRGALAEALYVRYYRRPPSRLFAGAGQPLENEGVAACLVRRDPAKVDMLLRHAPDSVEAEAARAGLSSFLDDCGRNGESDELISPSLRGELAENMFLRARGLTPARQVERQ